MSQGRQPHMKRTASAGRSGGLDPDGTAVLLDDTLADRQPEPQPTERGTVRAPEPLEDDRLTLLRHAETPIGDGDLDGVPGPLGLDLDRAPLPCIPHRVRNHVPQPLPDP